MGDPADVVTPSDVPCGWRGYIFAYDLAIVAALLLAGYFYLYGHYAFAAPTAGGAISSIDIAVRAMWFGAMGGIVISLKGVYDHCCAHGDWDDCFNLWHVGRPSAARSPD